MNEQQRHHHGDNPGDPDPVRPAGSGNLEQTRQRATAFFAAADAAIKNALSGNSTKFNQSARQEGGQ